MPRNHRHEEMPEDELPEPLDARSIITPEAQRDLMLELRRLTNRIAGGYRARDQRMHALVVSNALSRRDIAAATGLAESRVNQIVRELAEHQREGWAKEGRARVARHTA